MDIKFSTAVAAHLVTGDEQILQSIVSVLNLDEKAETSKIMTKYKKALSRATEIPLCAFSLSNFDTQIAHYLVGKVAEEDAFRRHRRWGYQASELPEVRIYSDWSLGETGFIDVSEVSANYYAMLNEVPKPPKRKKRSDLSVLKVLLPQGKSQVISKINQLSRSMECEVLESEEGLALQIENITALLDRDTKFKRVYLLDPTDTALSMQVNLNPLQIKSEGRNLLISTSSVELTMQLHAAALKNCWMVLEYSNDQTITFPLPDPTEAGKSKPVRASLARKFLEPYIVEAGFPNITLDDELVSALSEKFWWFSPAKASDAIQILSKV